MLHRKSSASVTLQWLDRPELLARLGATAARIRTECPEVRAVYLFGSLARGDQQGTSDADVLILLKGDPPFDPLEQTRRFLGFFDLPIGVDILVYSEGQLAARLQEGDPFLTAAWQDQIEL